MVVYELVYSFVVKNLIQAGGAHPQFFTHHSAYFNMLHSHWQSGGGLGGT